MFILEPNYNYSQQFLQLLPWCRHFSNKDVSLQEWKTLSANFFISPSAFRFKKNRFFCWFEYFGKKFFPNFDAERENKNKKMRLKIFAHLAKKRIIGHKNRCSSENIFKLNIFSSFFAPRLLLLNPVTATDRKVNFYKFYLRVQT